ncbi:interleukin-22 receptor subunit alpha-2 [Arapaima gigas]
MGLLAFWLLCISTLNKNPEVLGNEDVLRDLMPQQVRFHSLDYRNVLHWKTPPYTNQNLKYFVQYKVYGDRQWTNVTQCQGTSQLSCDLSQQTSEPREWYYARVQTAFPEVRSGWALSPRFNPQWETSVSAPSVQLNVTEQGIKVRLRPPPSPYRRRQGSVISTRKLQKLMFRIFITHNGVLQETREVDGWVTKLLIGDLNPRTTYCLQAEAHLLRQGRSGTRSNPICITTL